MLLTKLHLGKSFKIDNTTIKIVKLIKNKHNEVNGLALAIDPDPDTKITFEKKESSRKNAGGNE